MLVLQVKRFCNRKVTRWSKKELLLVLRRVSCLTTGRADKLSLQNDVDDHVVGLVNAKHVIIIATEHSRTKIMRINWWSDCRFLGWYKGTNVLECPVKRDVEGSSEILAHITKLHVITLQITEILTQQAQNLRSHIDGKVAQGYWA
jgi:hypothetical protein